MGIPFLDILDVVGKVVDRVIPDPAAKMDLQLKLAQLADQEAQREHDEMLGQMQTNTAEATNPNMFVAGWRPFIGWVGGVGLAYSFVVEPVASWAASVIFKYGGAFPTLDTSTLMTLITGMLGFGGLRTYEKLKGVPDSTPTAPAMIDTPAPVKKKKPLGGLWPF